MKRVLFILLITINSAWAIEPPFKHGVNLTQWFQSQTVGQIQFTRYTKQDLTNIKSLGCDVVRLPINLHAMTNGAPNYTINPLLFTLLDQVVDWAEELDLNLILDNHSFDPAVATPSDIGNILVPVWTQMAQHYKNRSSNIYYEVLNEPHGISDSNWNSIQQLVINAIRSVDTTHSIIVGPANFNSYQNLSAMPYYSDDNLIYTFHFYDPYLFTHQGVDWTIPSMKDVANIPFPFSWERMPQMPSQYYGTKVEDYFNSYYFRGTFEALNDAINSVAEFKDARSVPVYCGEFGVYNKTSGNLDRLFWYFLVRMLLESNVISWTTWDYQGGFGLFEKDTFELFNYDLNVLLVRLLGFHAPPQYEFYLWPDVTGFDIYRDYIGPDIIDTSYLTQGLLDYYSVNNPEEGNYCIHFTGVQQYGKISLRFSPIKDLSVLKAGNYALDLYVRSANPATQFDIRFVDTKTSDPADHPWRMGYKVDNTNAVWNGTWNHLHIPMSNFTEQGSFDGQYFPPVGDFEWSAVESFEIVSEYGNLVGTDLYFDDIKVAP